MQKVYKKGLQSVARWPISLLRQQYRYTHMFPENMPPFIRQQIALGLVLMLAALASALVLVVFGVGLSTIVSLLSLVLGSGLGIALYGFYLLEKIQL
ncbi:MAG: hypothetical protein WAX89_06240 [Alphaproteobacteria bacterium]